MPAVAITLLVVAGCGETSGSAGPGPAGGSTTEAAPETSDNSSKGPEAQPPADGPLPDRRTGAVEMEDGTGCVAEYSAEAVGSRDFAFDGTVTGIGHTGVTFEVNEWFVGSGGTAKVIVTMGGPTQSDMSESAPSYSVGTRLLVSGENATAWSCGFTRYFDERTAVDWRSRG